MLTKRQVNTLKKHSQHHTKKHMETMKRHLRLGKTFAQAHTIAMRTIGK